MTELDLGPIRARVERATEGPWHVEYFGEHGYPQRIGNDAAVIVADTHWGGGGVAPDAEFIAHAREDVPALVAEVVRLRAELAARTGEAVDAVQMVEDLTSVDSPPCVCFAARYDLDPTALGGFKVGGEPHTQAGAGSRIKIRVGDVRRILAAGKYHPIGGDRK